tara:strand:- start:422 stop:1333 length:912 start_codon:yes stop_codon:yes gene_type:complete
MSNFEYVAENQSPNPDMINNPIPDTIVGAPNPGDNLTGQPNWINPMNISYCNPPGASYFPLDNITVNPEDLFNNNNVKSVIEIKSLRESTYDILNKKSSFSDEEYDDLEFKDEKMDELITDINKYVKNFDKLQEEIYDLDKELKKEIESINKNINKLDGVIEFLLKLDIKSGEEEDGDEDMKVMVESVKKVSKRISKTEKFNEIKKNYVAKRKELNKYIYLLTNLNKLNISNRCPICLDSTIDHYLDPCGHTMCRTCIEKNMQMNNRNNHINQPINIDSLRNNPTNCPVCRKIINEARKLYIL